VLKPSNPRKHGRETEMKMMMIISVFNAMFIASELCWSLVTLFFLVFVINKYFIIVIQIILIIMLLYKLCAHF